MDTNKIGLGKWQKADNLPQRARLETARPFLLFLQETQPKPLFVMRRRLPSIAIGDTTYQRISGAVGYSVDPRRINP